MWVGEDACASAAIELPAVGAQDVDCLLVEGDGAMNDQPVGFLFLRFGFPPVGLMAGRRSLRRPGPATAPSSKGRSGRKSSQRSATSSDQRAPVWTAVRTRARYRGSMASASR